MPAEVMSLLISEVQIPVLGSYELSVQHWLLRLTENKFFTFFISTHKVCFYEELQKNYPRIITKYSSLTLVLLNKLMPRPLLIFSQPDYLIRIVAINSHT